MGIFFLVLLSFALPQNENVTEELSSLEESVSNLEELYDNLSQENQQVNRKILLLIANQESLETTLNQHTNILNAVSAGLTSLQINLNNTQTEVAGLKEQASEMNKFRLSIVIILFLVFFAALAGVLFYIFYYKPALETKIHPELKKHIYQHLKKGRVYSDIRKELLEAGWPAEQIDSAYKIFLTYRYRKYLEAKPALLFKKPAKEIDKRKVMVVAGVSVLLLAGIFFLLSGTIGKAIQVQRIFAHEEPFICTPPHIVTEGGCCLDTNANGICDVDEKYEKERAEISAAVCSDHRDCISGEVCIDGHCGILRELYKTDCPGLDKCNINKIEVFTSDGETYTLHAKKGSYTAAGALAWTIRPVPNYCKGEAVKIPIEIEKTDLICYDDLEQEISCEQETSITCRTDKDCTACPDLYGIPCYCHTTDSKGTCVKDVISKIDVQILSKEIITLTEGQTSKEMHHPNQNVNKTLGGFTLTFTKANEFCFLG